MSAGVDSVPYEFSEGWQGCFVLAGVCFRLYSQLMYEEEMPTARCPAVAEANLSHLVLLLKRLDIADMGQCKFLDRPGQISD